MLIQSDTWIEVMDRWCAEKIPFLFLLDFELNKPFICKIIDLEDTIYYVFPNSIKKAPFSHPDNQLIFRTFPIEKSTFNSAIHRVMDEQKKGNSYLLNLTFPSQVETNYTLASLYQAAQAKYKVYFRNEWIVFSPETFVTIREGVIRTHPMKGTINAAVPNAANILLADGKETAEHNTIVDLLRNDLSQVARHVQVVNYRYMERIQKQEGALLQVSSEITGTLRSNYENKLGSLFAKLLPAGSISGAPKDKTIDIIRKNEVGPRGYYTGICGIFDGENTESAVMIRFIERKGEHMYFRSGGGITTQSNPESEYKELIEKMYVPIG